MKIGKKPIRGRVDDPALQAQLFHSATFKGRLPPIRDEIRELLGDQFDAIQKGDRRARLTRPYWRRHRLMVLLDVLRAYEDGGQPRLGISPLAALGELRIARDVFRDGCREGIWPKLRSSLRTNDEYPHTLVLLAIAKLLRDSGNEVLLEVEHQSGRVGDLRIQAADRSINFEVKVPSELLWEVDPLTPKQANQHIPRLFKAAGTGLKGQLPPPHSGMLVIGGLHFSERTRDLLQKAAERHFERPPSDYGHIMGVLFTWVHTWMTPAEGELSGNRISFDTQFITAVRSELVPNPGYRGHDHLRLKG